MDIASNENIAFPETHSPTDANLSIKELFPKVETYYHQSKLDPADIPQIASIVTP